MKGNTVCRIREILYAEHIMIVCIGGEIQCAEKYKFSVQRRTNTVCRWGEMQCSEEYKYSVHRSKNRVCREIEIQCAEEYNTNTVCRGGVGETGIWHLGTPLRALPLLVTQPSTPAHRNPTKVFKIQITNTSLCTTMYKATHVTHPRFSLSPSYRMGLRYITRVILFTSVTLITLVTLVILSLFQSALQGRVYHHFGIFVTCLQSYFFNVKRGSDSLH